MTHAQQPTPPPHRHTSRLLLLDRGDPVVAPLSTALGERYDVVGRLDTELSQRERLLVAASTIRAPRRVWAERFFKSNLGVELRSRRARAALAGSSGEADVVFQTHALFTTDDARTVMYVDCTHRQAMEQWPDWNPLAGRGLKRWLSRETEQYQQAAHVFAFYDETARVLVEQYGVSPDRVSVVGAGTTVPALPQRHHRPETPTILFVGNDFERKGGLALLEAFATLRAELPGARLRIVGEPYPIASQPGVEQLGRVHGRERMSQLYSEADVFCLPSYFDPFPGALLEAMAHGLPCVVTATSGIPDIVDPHTALTVGRGATMAAEITAALHRLLTRPDDAVAMGARGRRRVQERFQWSHVVERMAPALDGLARPGPTNHAHHLPNRPSTTTSGAHS